MNEMQQGPGAVDTMGSAEMTRTLLVWFVLVGATVSTYLIGAERAINSDRIVAAMVIGIAAVKVWLVAWQFMEVNRAPAGLRHAINAYCVGLVALLLALYLIG